MNNNLFNQLQTMAMQAMPQNYSQPETVDSVVDNEQIQLLGKKRKQVFEMFPDNSQERFNYWKTQVDTTGMTAKAKQTYWKDYEAMHPEGIVGAKRDFVDVTKRELDYIESPVAKEFFLRERLDNTPEWARKELDPILGELSTIVANSNYAKAQQVYMKDLDLRINRFAVLAQLDPDVSVENHTTDITKLEQMNLLEVAKVEQGRVGVYSKGGQFIPAFGLQSRNDVFENDSNGSPSLEEQSVIRSLAPTIIKKAIQGNLAVARNKIMADERAGIAVAEKYLTDGAFNFDQWDTAFSMLHSVPMYDKIKLGLRGEITAGRIKTESDLKSAIYQSVSKYSSVLQADIDSNKDNLLTKKELENIAEMYVTTMSTRRSKRLWEMSSISDFVGSTNPDYIETQKKYEEAVAKVPKSQLEQLRKLEESLLQTKLKKLRKN